MDPTQQRAAGFVLPGEDPDDLVNTTQAALAAVAPLSAAFVNLQAENQQLQQMVQENRNMMTAMMLQAKDMQAQVTTGRLMPILPQVVAHSGLLMDLPAPAMTSFSMSREVTADGAVTEQVTLTFDPTGLTRAQGDAQAVINHSESFWSKVQKLTGPSR
jgi:hypothetical protein